MTFVVLDGGVSLPIPEDASNTYDPFHRAEGIKRTRWENEKQSRWQRAYTHCLYSLPNLLEDPIHSAVTSMSQRMMGVHNGNSIATRFLGEMWLAGYITLNEQPQRGQKDKTERIIQATDLFLGLNLDIKEAPETTITMPTSTKERQKRMLKIRHGMQTLDNRKVVEVCNDIGAEEFTVNTFIVELVRKYRPGEDDPTFKSEYMLDRSLDSADKLTGTSFRFDQFLCSRGRTYAAATCGLSPGGCDWEKAMLIPTYKEPLTIDGVFALKEAADGYSEQDWDIATMVSHARDPDAYVAEWQLADKPFSYMACADLLRQYWEAPYAPLPAFNPLDGRCSGLQHLSALTRSESITQHIGMDDIEADQDIYERVAADWKETLPEDEKIYATRKSAKIPTMTWGYNATRMTSMDWMDKQFGEVRRWNRKEKQFDVIKAGLSRADAGRLGADLYNGLNDTLFELRAVVDWLSDCARMIASANNPSINWPTPDGFECTQRKVKGEEVAIFVTLSNGEVFRVGILDFTNQEPHVAKHVSALSPNVIHSLDATHLRMVARRLKELGLPMVFVHDSFSTHANHRETLYRLIVEEFAKLYSENWMKTLRYYWIELYHVDIPRPPKLGTWEPENIKILKKFFM